MRVRPSVRTRAARSVCALLASGCLLAGCGAVLPGRAVVARGVPSADMTLIRSYVDALNAAGEAGAAAQAQFLADTQDPDAPAPRPGCLGRVTLETRLVERTVRPDPDWAAPRGQGPPARPLGAVYVVAVGVSASQDGVALREEIGSKHLVLRGGRVFGYSPCPS